MSQLELKNLDLRDADTAFDQWLAANESEYEQDWSSEHAAICTELYNNAINHGILRVRNTDSQAPEFWQQRAIKLASAVSERDWVKLRCERAANDELCISASDSGDGIELSRWELMQWLSLERGPHNEAGYGRGLWLVQNLAKTVEYKPLSNTFIVRCKG